MRKIGLHSWKRRKEKEEKGFVGELESENDEVAQINADGRKEKRVAGKQWGTSIEKRMKLG